MLRRLTLGFASILAAATVFAACGGSGTNAISVGPNFPSQSLYATNSTQNGVSIYPPGTKTGSGPVYQIGGSSTTLAGPQYLAFDNLDDLYITNYNVSASAASIVEIKALATGNVIPYNAVTLASTVRPRGIASFIAPTASPQPTSSPISSFVVAAENTAAGAGFTSQLQFFNTALLQYQTIAGPNTGLDIPSGVAVDPNATHVYVTNLQAGTVEVFAMPTATPSPAATATPTATPAPTATPVGATPSPTPTPIPTASPMNVSPQQTITGVLRQPSGVALDASGNMYVSDLAAVPGTTYCASSCPAIIVYGPGSNGSATPKSVIAGSNTGLFAPTDVKLDKTGNIYVADTTKAGAGVVYVFAPNTSGNVAPTTTYTSPGAIIGIGLTP